MIKSIWRESNMKNSKKPLNEQKVLDKLGIDDFRHLSKEKVIEFVSLVPNMEPEVAKAAIEQFPEFSSVMKSIMIDYKQEIESALNQNDDTVKKYYNACDKILDSLDKLLDDTDLDLNEKMQIIDNNRRSCNSDRRRNRNLIIRRRLQIETAKQ